jgi:hypothetical protein
MAGKSDEMIRNETKAWAESMDGLRIVKKNVLSDDEVHLVMTAPATMEGLRSGQVTVVMKKIGGAWKQAGDK